MGSKNLKTIVLNCNKKVDIFNREKFYDLIKEYHKATKIKPLTSIKKSLLGKLFGMVKSMRRLKIGMVNAPDLMRTIYRNYGTSIGNTISAETGDSPIKNWSGIGMYDFPYEKSVNLSS
ncbi:MAG: hypothetical protein ACTSQU_19275, partial [Promethearchaeota archaeon]